MKSRRMFWCFPLIAIGLVLFFSSGCKKKELIGPTVTTGEITLLSDTTIICSGTVVSGGNSELIARGICWSVNSIPRLGNYVTFEGCDVGPFNSKLTGLVPNTTYNVRAYATNQKGTNYGNMITFTAGH